MSAIYTEVDLLDSMEAPAEACYGVHTQCAINNHQISGKTTNDVSEFTRDMVMVRKAVATANQRVRTLPSDIAETIAAAYDEILEEGRYMDQFPIDVFQGEAGASVNTDASEVTTNLVPEFLGQGKGRYDTIHPNGDVDQCQLANDAYPTGFRLVAHMSLLNLQKHFDSLAEALYIKDNKLSDIVTVGRTQLRDAVLMTPGQVFHAFVNNLKEGQESIVTASACLLRINLSAIAIGTGVDASAGYREAVTRALREVGGSDVSSAKDLIEVTSDTGVYVNVRACSKCVAMKISKMRNNLRLLASGSRVGLNEINLLERAAGLSVMPAEVSPVIPEVTNQVCFEIFDNGVALTWTTEVDQF